MQKLSSRFMLLIGTVVVVVGFLGATLFYVLPQQEQNHIVTAEAAQAAGDYPSAIDAYNRALAVRPAFVRRSVDLALRGRGIAHFQDQNFQAALDDFAQLPPELIDSEIIIQRAESLWAVQEREAAVAELTDAIEGATPEDSLLFLEKRGLFYRNSGQYAAALTDFEAIPLKSSSQAVDESRQALLVTQGQTAEALAHAADLFELDKLSTPVALSQGRLLYHNQRFDEAVAAFELVDDPSQYADYGPYLVLSLLSSGRADDAQEQLALLQNKFPDHPLVLAAAGRSAAVEGDLVRAIQLLNQAEVNISELDYPHMLYLRGRSHLEAGQTAAALSDAETVLALEPDNFWGFWLRGDINYTRQAYPQASFDFEQALSRQADTPAVLLSQGRNYLAEGELGAAAAAVSQAVAVIGPTAPASVLNAQIAVAQGDLDSAISALTAVPAEQQTAQSFALWGELLLEAGDDEAAVTQLTAALSLDPAQAAARQTRAAAYIAGDQYDAALEDILLALQDTPESILLYQFRIQAHLALGDVAAAARTAEQVLRLDNSVAIAHYAVGQQQLDQENYFDAVIALSDAIELDDTLAEAYVARAESYYWQRENDRAQADANRAVSIDENLAGGYMVQALVEADRQAWNDALDLADQALDLDPDNDSLVAQRGEIYLISGTFNRALDDFNRAIELNPERSEWYLLKAAALEELQRFDEALEILGEAIALTPRDTVRGLSVVEIGESLQADIERIPPAVDGFRTWEDLYHRFAISYPADWRQFVDPGFESPIFLQGPLDKDYRANLIVVVIEDVNLSLSQVARAFDPPGTLPDFELVDTRSTSVGGRSAIRKSFRWTASDERLRDIPVAVIQYYALINGRVFLLTATMRAEDVEKYEPIFDGMVDSISLAQ